MCIGIPMRVTAVQPGHALCEGRGEQRRVNTALVGSVAPGDWLLVFLTDAREHIDVMRAAEIDATLDLVASAMQGLDDLGAAAAFALPSQMSAAQLHALAHGL
jgi:hydrogenase expression/formation protein HypC